MTRSIVVATFACLLPAAAQAQTHAQQDCDGVRISASVKFHLRGGDSGQPISRAIAPALPASTAVANRSTVREVSRPVPSAPPPKPVVPTPSPAPTTPVVTTTPSTPSLPSPAAIVPSALSLYSAGWAAMTTPVLVPVSSSPTSVPTAALLAVGAVPTAPGVAATSAIASHMLNIPVAPTPAAITPVAATVASPVVAVAAAPAAEPKKEEKKAELGGFGFKGFGGGP